MSSIRCMYVYVFPVPPPSLLSMVSWFIFIYSIIVILAQSSNLAGPARTHIHVANGINCMFSTLANSVCVSASFGKSFGRVFTKKAGHSLGLSPPLLVKLLQKKW